ncbi:Mps3p NDAI_0C02840 [Naumovozyma dairenensis CBS 421]|uniref:SUN domain-containing protein n=1 Tax=Naumovozyma dairenensis (strain ATCC 10597 / BCRC 20456 / CBS 421 / NBRC 0211 / NRRL Y-12639) TaxID=1071378 RepID=G0W833_NAUDC|nr:hypothetical protein NDAI_0C02840 [Naumovozyma dairenensis CBS 421]CCD23944.1 hypothetical protein NDAI_0C02840 [Naumovozyma dairenensis CBS 421]
MAHRESSYIGVPDDDGMSGEYDHTPYLIGITASPLRNKYRDMLMQKVEQFDGIDSQNKENKNATDDAGNSSYDEWINFEPSFQKQRSFSGESSEEEFTINSSLGDVIYTDDDDADDFTDNEEEPQEEPVYSEGSNYYYDGNENEDFAEDPMLTHLTSILSHLARVSTLKKILSAKFLLMIAITMAVASGILFNHPNRSNLDSTTVNAQRFKNENNSALMLQKQLDHISRELSQRNQNIKLAMNQRITILISQLEKNIKSVIPTNEKKIAQDLDILNRDLKFISSIISSRKLENKKGDRKNMLPNEIDILINNNITGKQQSSLITDPKLQDFVVNTRSALKSIFRLEPNIDLLNIRAVLDNYTSSDAMDYVTREYMSNIVSKSFSKTKSDILDYLNLEIHSLRGKQCDDETSIKAFISQLIDSLTVHVDNELDYGTLEQGSQILPYLTSRSYRRSQYNSNPLTAFQSNELFYCKSEPSCSIAIRFKEPIYLTSLKYSHGRFTNNVHALNSAPKIIVVYIKLHTKDAMILKTFVESAYKHSRSSNSEGNIFYDKDKSYIKISESVYDLANNKITQDLSLPLWFTNMKLPVRSIIFEVHENYGHTQYTAFGKVSINGITQEDLNLMIGEND